METIVNLHININVIHCVQYRCPYQDLEEWQCYFRHDINPEQSQKYLLTVSSQGSTLFTVDNSDTAPIASATFSLLADRVHLNNKCAIWSSNKFCDISQALKKVFRV